jgi:threonyl-tRNA synthetase
LKWEAPLITCSAYGPFERLFGLLLEQHQGVLPFGLVPEQVRVLLVGKEARAEALSLMQILASKGVRANLDERLEPVGKRIHQALREKVPYAIVFGEREQRSGALTIRRHDLPQEQKMRLEEFIQEIKIRRETFDFEN